MFVIAHSCIRNGEAKSVRQQQQQQQSHSPRAQAVVTRQTVFFILPRSLSPCFVTDQRLHLRTSLTVIAQCPHTCARSTQKQGEKEFRFLLRSVLCKQRENARAEPSARPAAPLLGKVACTDLKYRLLLLPSARALRSTSRAWSKGGGEQQHSGQHLLPVSRPALCSLLLADALVQRSLRRSSRRVRACCAQQREGRACESASLRRAQRAAHVCMRALQAPHAARACGLGR